MELLIIIAIVAVLGFFGWISNIIDEKNNLKSSNEGYISENNTLQTQINNWHAYSSELNQKQQDIKKREELFSQLFRERTANFPIVANIWNELIEITESERERALKYKTRPALVAAAEVSSMKKEKKELVKELVSWKYKAQNYEAIYPWLVDELAEDIDDQIQSDIYYSVYTEAERSDPVSNFISPEDFRKLNVSDRNQLALDRYWQRGKKTKWMIGKMYERYVGYVYEKDGWDVEYFGIHKRYEDLGRDLIATKGSIIHVIQCKNWAHFKTIYENHIFQLFGTAYSMRKGNPGKQIIPVFYTSTSLSDTAAEFAKLLGIEVNQNKKFANYPCVKCNISTKGERIYHLPFDQQYDTIKITPKTGEYYADTISDAEKGGFRRAFRWSGVKS